MSQLSWICIAALFAATAAFTTTGSVNLGNANGGLTISSFDPRPASETPGNVGLCFSGGGSRAASLAWGQLRGLNHLGLLSQAKSISSVSGGSWGTVPFTYLPDTISDSDFLGPYVSDPSTLYITGILNPFAPPDSQVDIMRTNNYGAALNANSLGLLAMAVQAPILYAQGCPSDRLWSYMIAQNILAPFGLASFDSNYRPTKFFCAASECAQIQSNNPQFAGYNPVRTGSSIRRPFHIVNTAMFVKDQSNFDYEVPFQATPYFSGVVGTGSQASYVLPSTNQQVGGGTVSSYAFNSQLVSTSGGDVSVTQNSPFALSDITGSSSAAFAEVVKNDASFADGLDPAFSYWTPSLGSSATSGTARFADGGTIDNSGVLGTLAYTDIDKLVAFINTETAFKVHSSGLVEVDSSLPPLFGYQPFDSTNGYVPYPAPGTAMPNAMNTEFRFNQVFDSSLFDAMVQGLVAASNGNTNAAIFLQQGLPVMANSWWGIQGGKSVDVLWVYNQASSSWSGLLETALADVLSLESFPQVSTSQTSLPNTIINCLAHFSSWTLVTNQNLLFQVFSSPAPSSLYFTSDGALTPHGRNMAIAVGLSATATLLIVVAVVAIIIRRRRAQLNRRDVELMP